MDKGDFFVHFMDLTEEELKKPVDDIIPPRLEALLELALRMSTANTDPFKDDLKVECSSIFVTVTSTVALSNMSVCAFYITVSISGVEQLLLR